MILGKGESVSCSVVFGSLRPHGLCSPPGSSVHGILQARILEWDAIPLSSGSFWPRDWTMVSCIAGRSFTIWATKVYIKNWNPQFVDTRQVLQHIWSWKEKNKVWGESELWYTQVSSSQTFCFHEWTKSFVCLLF